MFNVSPVFSPLFTLSCFSSNIYLELISIRLQDMCNGEEGSFRVLVENEACGLIGRRCAKSVRIYYNGGLIVMEKGEVRSIYQIKRTDRNGITI